MQILFSSIWNMKKPINLEKELTFGQDDLYLTLFISLNSNFGPRIFCVIFYNLFSVDRSDDKTHPSLRRMKTLRIEIQGKIALTSRRENQFIWVTWNWGVCVKMIAHLLNAQALFTLGWDVCLNAVIWRYGKCPQISEMFAQDWWKKHMTNKRPAPLWKDWDWTCLTELSLCLHLVKWELGHFIL